MTYMQLCAGYPSHPYILACEICPLLGAAMPQKKECCVPPPHAPCPAIELLLDCRMYILALRRFALCDSLSPGLVEEIDDDVVLLHPQAVEVLSHHIRQLVFVLPPEVFASCNCRRVEANATGLGEDPAVVVADEGGRRLQAVCSAVRVENVSFEGGPLKLLQQESVSNCVVRRKNGKQCRKTGRRLTPGVLGSCVLTVGSGAGAAALVALAFVTSRRLEPALLATLRILLLEWDAAAPPFFSFDVGVSALESSWPLRAALEGAMGEGADESKESRGCAEEVKRQVLGVLSVGIRLVTSYETGLGNRLRECAVGGVGIV